MSPLGQCKPEGSRVGIRHRAAAPLLSKAGGSSAAARAAQAMCCWYCRDPCDKRVLGTSSWLGES